MSSQNLLFASHLLLALYIRLVNQDTNERDTPYVSQGLSTQSLLQYEYTDWLLSHRGSEGSSVMQDSLLQCRCE